MVNAYHIDLTKQAPRSPRVRLGGFAILPRMLDKGRATVAGKAGEYHFDCPLDNQFLGFVGLKGSEIRPLLEQGKSDWEILDWIMTNARNRRNPYEISAWSTWQETRSPGDVESLQYFGQTLTKAAPHRKDINTWFELLDVDDYASFGGKA